MARHLGGPHVEVLRQGCTEERDYLCLGSHVWAELPQAAPCQERQEYLNVMVGTKALCPQVAESQIRAGSGLPLDLRETR